MGRKCVTVASRTDGRTDDADADDNGERRAPPPSKTGRTDGRTGEGSGGGGGNRGISEANRFPKFRPFQSLDPEDRAHETGEVEGERRRAGRHGLFERCRGCIYVYTNSSVECFPLITQPLIPY